MTEFIPFQKIPRLSRSIVITEKIDGSNGVIYIGEDGEFLVGSRKRWITPGKGNDNFNFAEWAYQRKEELLQLGPGWHHGEWWGVGIQRGYSLSERRFSLFNVHRWNSHNPPPSCCHVVPVLYSGDFNTQNIDEMVETLRDEGSCASPGFMKPEGIIVYHKASNTMFKKLLENDELRKGEVE